MNLSIIIPLYNAEKFIGRCLNSIFNQNVDERLFEVIIVNDGSSDSSITVIDSFLKLYKNCKLINQKNSGASVARNTGLSLARGEYVWFIDDDDEVTSDSILKIMDYCKQYPKADFLIFDCKHYNIKDNTQNYTCSFGKKHIGFNLKRDNDLYLKPLDRNAANKRLQSAVIWLHIYKSSFLLDNDLFLTPGILHEDDEVRLRRFFFAKEIRYIPYAHYIYTILRPGSLTSMTIPTLTMKSVLDWIKTLDSWDRFCGNNVKSRADKIFVNGFYKTKYSQLMLLCNTPHDSEMYTLYQAHKKEWRKKYIKSFFGSHPTSLVEYIRFFVTLLCPQYVEYLNWNKMRKLIPLKRG
jgi:glycosyltransferase involved in cell wall biosynthesis